MRNVARRYWKKLVTSLLAFSMAASLFQGITIQVNAEDDPQTKIENALDSLYLPSEVTGNLTLVTEGEDQVAITWKSGNEQVISTQAEDCSVYYDEVEIPAGVVTRQNQDTRVTLTATGTLSGASVTRKYEVTVKAKSEEKEYAGYLYAHFNEHATGGYDGIQQIFFGISKNGYDWSALNNNQFVAESSVGDHGVRDPYIIRSAEGDKFYMIATDLDIDFGAKYDGVQNWGKISSYGYGSQNLVIWESTDLLNWSEPWLGNVGASIDANMTWAPEAIYDEATGEYLVFWSSRTLKSSKDYIYVSKTRDFRTFTDAEVYSDYANGNDSSGGTGVGNIDASIFKEGDKYYRLIKDERDNHIILQSSEKLLAYGDDADSVTIGGEQLPNRGSLFTRIVNNASNCLETFNGSEGPTMFKFNDQEAWCILIDEYAVSNARGYIPFITYDLDEPNSVKMPGNDTYIMPDAAKHGTVISITQEEYDALMAAYGTEKQEDNKIKKTTPVLKYDFENVSGSTVEDTIGLNDSQLTGTAVVAEDSVTGSNVLLLDGNTGSALSFPNGFFDGLDQMTISMDVKAANTTGALFGVGSTVTNKISSYTYDSTLQAFDEIPRYYTDSAKISNRYLNLTMTDSKVTGTITTFNSSGEFKTTANQSGLLNTWVNVKLVMDDHVMKIYLDNQLIAANEHVRTVSELGYELTACIGNAYGKTEAFIGAIDNVEVYNRAISEKDLIIADEAYKSQLKSLISQVKLINPEQYTQESVNVLGNALAEAETIYNDAGATQYMVDEAYTALVNAQNNLQKKVVLTGITVTKAPTKTVYAIGETFDGRGMAVSATYSDKSTRQITDYAIAEIGFTASGGSKTVTISYMEGGVTATANISVYVKFPAPKSVKAVQKSAKAVKISWGKVTGAKQYEVYRSTKAAGGYVKLNTTTSNSYTDKKAAVGKTYYYKVVTVGNSTITNSVQSSAAKVSLLKKPAVKLVSAKKKQVKVSWKKIGGAAGYEVYVSTKKNSGFKKKATPAKANKVSSIVKKLNSGKKYYFRVRAYRKVEGKKVYGAYSKVESIYVK